MVTRLFTLKGEASNHVQACCYCVCAPPLRDISSYVASSHLVLILHTNVIPRDVISRARCTIGPLIDMKGSCSAHFPRRLPSTGWCLECPTRRTTQGLFLTRERGCGTASTITPASRQHPGAPQRKPDEDKIHMTLPLPPLLLHVSCTLNTTCDSIVPHTFANAAAGHLVSRCKKISEQHMLFPFSPSCPRSVGGNA